ncbi:MAG TPA: molybdopterin-guanine dinucleotide biosynthesis protein B, partial [Nitrospirota bacterium]|nr:molybdopterin-guanine dinucleotide biosynthesis protein B [Nitrospirota bacterium]
SHLPVVNMRIVSFVAASSNSGKTTLIEKIVAILKARGLRVAVVKHASAGFELDKPGKDSWRFRQAGADAVVLVGPDCVALVKNISREPSTEDLASLFADVDVVIQEGFKHSAVNRIEVFRSGVSGNRPLCLSDRSYLALVSDRPIEVAIPRFDWNDAEGVAEFIVNSPDISHG